MSTTYVYDELEVKMTGRTASRKGKRATSRQTDESMEILYEIEPVDKMTNWQKWVSLGDLFEIGQVKSNE